MLMCLELVVMDLCVMWNPRKYVFSVKSKIAMVIIVYAVLVLIVCLGLGLMNASPAILLMMLVVDLMNAVMVLVVKLLLGKGGFVSRPELDNSNSKFILCP